MKDNRKIDFSIGIFDQISENIKEKIRKESNSCEIYGIGVYTDEIVMEEYMTYPVRKFDERMELVKQLDGVDFVFCVDNRDVNELKKL